MKLHTLLLLLALAAIAAFSAMNWGVLIAPTALSLGFTTVQMPLGLVMLGLMVFITALFLVFVVYLQGSALLETRRHTRELQINREVVERTEASRIAELRTFLENELSKQADLNVEAKSAVIGRIDQLEQDLRSLVEQSGNSLAACIGELDDRLEKITQIAPTRVC